MFGIAKMRYSLNRHEQTQTAFGGYDHREGAGDGAIYDCVNMSADKYPLVTTRKRRRQYAHVQKPNGMMARDCLCWVDGTALIVDGVEVGQVADSRKVMCGIQDKIVIWPDKVLYDRGTGELKPLEASWTGQASVTDGTYAGEPAKANTIRAEGDLRPLFRAGDGLTVSTAGQSLGEYILREIEYQEGTTELRFYTDTWAEATGEIKEITIRRSVPDLDIAFEHHNRIWGAKGSTVFACALGDPTNWRTFDGLSTDAYELVIGSPGEITGGCSYGGRPVFFKERLIVKIYGEGPGSWQTSQTQSLGVEKGSAKSLAVAGDVLFYKSTEGIAAYTGGYPRNISEVFGGVRYRNATAGSDGVRYYVAMERAEDGEPQVFCYDTRCGLWHPENGMTMVDWGWDAGLYAMESKSGPGPIWQMGDTDGGEAQNVEAGLQSWVEFADRTEGTTRTKRPSRLLLRLEAYNNVELTVMVQYDSDGVWHTVRKITGDGRKRQFELPVQLRRCDHYRLRIEGLAVGYGDWTLHAITWERSIGSNRK